ncbi:hypothetical protein [Duganella phyllosphaerae]|uniref:Uncharacterized protein n=1 Tax=Duganella phyllosphaerae TaxID=762836 RepID=A0A1E7X6R7_9BURK|nr:hypothetical protein [Duganella phyllosphaerae]OFA08805.1 hypothetical protein DUPY_04810 [Duganella phyllosphaerae]
MSHQDQTTQETMITLLRACGFDMHNIKHGQHQVKGTIENATAFFKLITAGADANASASQDAEAELLDMLGRIHPMAMKREDDIGGGKERLTRAYTRQQPWPVPDQACIVWRADLMRMSNDLTHKQAFFDHTLKQEHDVVAGMPPDSGSDAALLEVGTMYITKDGSRIPSLRWPCRLLDGGEYTLYVKRDLGAQIPKSEAGAAPMTLERFNEKMDALDAANPAPLAKLEKSQPQR